MSMLDNPRAVIGGNRPPSLTEEINARHASLLAQIDAITATDLPMMVVSDEAAIQVSQVGREASELRGKLNEAHRIEKEPHLRAGREVDAWRNGILQNINAFLDECKALVGAWQDKREAEERAQREAEARRLAAAAAAAEQAAMRTMTPAAMEKAADVAEAAAEAEQAATATTAELARVTVGGKAVAARQVRWTYEVVSLADVPREYLTINDAAVKAAIANGIREVPGLRIFQQKTTSFR